METKLCHHLSPPHPLTSHPSPLTPHPLIPSPPHHLTPSQSGDNSHQPGWSGEPQRDSGGEDSRGGSPAGAGCSSRLLGHQPVCIGLLDRPRSVCRQGGEGYVGKLWCRAVSFSGGVRTVKDWAQQAYSRS